MRELPGAGPTNTWHYCSRKWRQPHIALPEGVINLFGGLGKVYSKTQAPQLAERVGEPLLQLGGLYPSLCAVPEK